jgi:hypothetical protein
MFITYGDYIRLLLDVVARPKLELTRNLLLTIWGPFLQTLTHSPLSLAAKPPHSNSDGE